jgi:hypothetical protein
MPVTIRICLRVAGIAVQIQSLRVRKVGIGYWFGTYAPIGANKSRQTTRVVPCPEVVEAGFDVAFFASEFVIVGVVVDELEFAAPGVIVGLTRPIRLIQLRAASITLCQNSEPKHQSRGNRNGACGQNHEAKRLQFCEELRRDQLEHLRPARERIG